MALTLNTRTYNADEITPNSVTYTGPAHTLSIQDTVTLSRVRPKANGSSKGVARSTYRQAATVVTNDATGETGLIVVRQEFSVPVWAAGNTAVTTKLAAMRADLASANGAQFMTDLSVNQDVNV